MAIRKGTRVKAFLDGGYQSGIVIEYLNEDKVLIKFLDGSKAFVNEQDLLVDD